MEESNIRVPSGKPPAALNGLMRLFLKTPGLQRWLGKGVALLTVTGRRSGKRYEIPISYDRQGDTVVMLTKRQRTWWHNFEALPAVELRLAGKTVMGHARAAVGDETELPLLTEFLEHRPIDAKAYGLAPQPDGHIDPEQARRLLAQIVVVRVTLS